MSLEDSRKSADPCLWHVSGTVPTYRVRCEPDPVVHQAGACFLLACVIAMIWLLAMIPTSVWDAVDR